MTFTRRNLLKHSAIALPGSMLLNKGMSFDDLKEAFPLATGIDKAKLIATAIDSAIRAGASYADARLTRNESFTINSFSPNPKQTMALGVRALYQGYWGFASSPLCSEEEANRIGESAVVQAKVNVLGRERQTELAPLEISNGEWETPVKDNPFNIAYEELTDFFAGFSSYASTLKFIKQFNQWYEFSRSYKDFGNSDGQNNSQILYWSSGNVAFKVEDKSIKRESWGKVEEISIAGKGFEYFRDRPIRQYLRNAHEEALNDLSLPMKPIDPGRYVVQIDQGGIANVLQKSIGKATEVDRVFGFEANTGGTSYITDPHTMLNTLKIGSNSVNVWCDRSEIGSAGCVRWDDEGVHPERYDLVKDGILVNLQTNREGASWVKDHYQNTQQDLRSFGTANSPSAMDVQITHPSDLYLMPSDTSITRDNLRESIDDGIEIRIPDISFDFQQITGWSRGGKSYEIKKGKREAILANAGMLFRTPELWNNIISIGGTPSVEYFGLLSRKGQPEQTIASGVKVPPCIVKEMTVIDNTRKA